MQIFDGLDNVPPCSSASVTVGSFDGLHLGHQKIVSLMQEANSGPITVLTFEPHPQTVVRPDIPPPSQLTSRAERIELFRQIGIEHLVFAKFDLAFAAMSAAEYVREVLVKSLGAKKLFTGPNHRFGKDRLGNVELLIEMSIALGFEVSVVEPVMIGDEVISSSRIRKKLLAGDATTAHLMLGKPYYLVGTVIRGEGRGRKLGFPTANLSNIAEGKLMPPPGIYSTVTEVEGERWPSVSHIGPRPTFSGAIPTIESHLIGFEGDLYGREIKIGLVGKLRDVVAFSGIGPLIEQMEIDRMMASDNLDEMGYRKLTDDKLLSLTENWSII